MHHDGTAGYPEALWTTHGEILDLIHITDAVLHSRDAPVTRSAGTFFPTLCFPTTATTIFLLKRLSYTWETSFRGIGPMILAEEALRS